MIIRLPFTIRERQSNIDASTVVMGFIRAEIYRPEDLKAAGSEAALKAQGKIRVEGKDYVMADGDVANYRFNV